MTTVIRLNEEIARYGGPEYMGETLQGIMDKYDRVRILWDVNSNVQINKKISLNQGVTIESESTNAPVVELVGDGKIVVNSDCVLRGIEFRQLSDNSKPGVKSFALRVSGNNIELEDIVLSGVSNYGMLVVDSENVSVSKCKIHGFNIAGVTLRDSTFQVSESTVDGCGHGIHMLGSAGVVTACTANGNSKHGFTVVHCADPVVISDCNSSGNSRNGFVFGGSSRDRPSNSNWRITGCTAQMNARNGISVDPTKKNSDEVVYQAGSIEECVSLENKTHGIFITHAENVSIIKCVCNDNRISGIALSKSREITINKSATIGNNKAEIAIYGTKLKNTGAYSIKSHINKISDSDVFMKDDPPLGIFIEK